MGRFLVSTRGVKPATVEAGNWLAALGLGLDRLGVVADIHRLACEVLPNGTVIARDVRSGSGFIVQPQLDPDERAEPDEEHTDPGTGGGGGGFVEPHTAEEGYANVRLMGDEEPSVDAPTAPRVPADTHADGPAAPRAARSSSRGPPPDLPSSAFEPLDDLPGDALQPIEDEATQDEELQDRVVLGLIDGVRQAPSDLVAWQTALDVALALVPCEAGSALAVEGEGHIRFVSAIGPNAHRLAAVRLPRGTGIAGFCMDRVVSLIVQDPKNDPRFFKTMDKLTGFRTRSMLAVPVAFEGTVYGCLELVNPPEDLSFTRIHIELMELVAAALADRLVVGQRR